jgi:WbqC-like protein family
MIVAMHQPTFLPWLGWWDKLVRADRLVLLDDVQFPKKGGTWMNRVRVLVNGEPAWLTVPIDRGYHGVRTVRETLIGDASPWRTKLASTIALNYKRAKYFDDVFPVVEELLGVPTDRIAELNETGIRLFAARLELDASKLVRQSQLHVEGAGTDLLVNLCRALHADTYLSGDGAGGYLEPEKFAAAGLELREQRFTPPRHSQLADEYVPGLSIVDALMNCGWEATRTLLGQHMPRSSLRSASSTPKEYG